MQSAKIENSIHLMVFSTLHGTTLGGAWDWLIKTYNDVVIGITDIAFNSALQ